MRHLDHALRYARLGWSVFPIHTIDSGFCTCGDRNCKSAGKHPIFKDGFKTATTDEQLIRGWWFVDYNIGIVTGKESGIWVLDVDAGKGGIESFKEEIDPKGEIEALTVATGGGGNHYFFKYPKNDEVRVPSRVNVKAGIDVRGDGGYVVAPPSKHKSGHNYEWLDGYSALADDDVKDLLNEFEPLEAETFGIYRDAFESNAFDWAMVEAIDGDVDEEELRKIKCALFVLDVDDREHWVMAGMALHSLSWDRAFDLWCEWSSASDKFDYDDSRRVWASFSYKPNGTSVNSLFYSANQIDPNFYDPEPLRFVMDEDILQQSDNHKDAIAQFPIFSLAETKLNPPEPPVSLWADGAISEGTVSLVVAPPKHRKSFMFMSMSMAAACGGDFLGHGFERPLKVLWIQAELQKSSIYERLKQVERPYTMDEREIIGENFLYSDRMSLQLETIGDINKLRRIVDHYAPDLLCIDPFFNFTLAEENSASELRKVLLNIASLRNGKNPNLSIVLIHHTKKNIEDGEVFEAIRGSGAFRGFYDFGLGILKDKTSGDYLFKFECRNRNEMPDMLVNYNDETGLWSESEFIDDRLIPEADPKYDGFFKFMNEFDRVSASDCLEFLTNSLGVTRSSAAASLKALNKQGWINKHEGGNTKFWSLYSKSFSV